MNLRLRVSKNIDAKDYSQGRYIRFAVVDLDKSKKYPANYVCMLPLQPRANGKVNNVFSELFGDESLELAKRLLTKALKNEGDQEIKIEIEKRLKLLEPKHPVQVRCRVCGNLFEPERRRFKQRICQDCRQKRYNSQE
ncbi:hypothetical protein E2P61_03200 [Candidatus Bathyarchaeota archaeon]|nr:hypothetical protein E2P61_03200 [Candidatus Bathyarchaeota archaeon]